MPIDCHRCGYDCTCGLAFIDPFHTTSLGQDSILKGLCSNLFKADTILKKRGCLAPLIALIGAFNSTVEATRPVWGV